MPSSRDILARHSASLHGRLKQRWMQSRALGIRKPFYVYEPPEIEHLTSLPVLYLFRGHEREWVNIAEDTSRHRSTAIEDIDHGISAGQLPAMLVVMPGLNSSNNHVPSLGIDMPVSPDGGHDGLGTGRFWTFLNEELFGRITCDYPQTNGGLRLAAGFSLGGFTVSLLAIHRPGYFHHAAMYDALFMWPGHCDPREEGKGETDPIWRRSALFDTALGNPRDAEAMRVWNPTDTLKRADAQRLRELKRTVFWIASADADGQFGNRDRSRYFGRLVRSKGLHLGFDSIVFSPSAAHNWHWTDRFLIRFLREALTNEVFVPF
jgi:enterochelin esterase-like enzyme